VRCEVPHARAAGSIACEWAGIEGRASAHFDGLHAEFQIEGPHRVRCEVPHARAAGSIACEGAGTGRDAQHGPGVRRTPMASTPDSR
jgi:hypothetical protein